MRRWIRIPPLAVALLACGPSNTYHGAASYTPEERTSIETAAATMAARTGGDTYTIVWDDGDDGDNRILREMPPAPDSDGEFVMSSRSYSRSIYIAPAVTGDRLRVVAMHEFGHSYGMDHHDGPGLMNRAAEDAWTMADIDDCHGVGMCQRP